MEYGDMEMSETARLKTQEPEGAKRLLPDTMRDIAVLKIFWERTDDARDHDRSQCGPP